MMLQILSVGTDKTLMAVRTLLLSNSGYTVEEAHSIEKAISFVEADSIDVTLICHTVPQRATRTYFCCAGKETPDADPVYSVLCLRNRSADVRCRR